jgi:hypothetical protein
MQTEILTEEKGCEAIVEVSVVATQFDIEYAEDVYF